MTSSHLNLIFFFFFSCSALGISISKRCRLNYLSNITIFLLFLAWCPLIVGADNATGVGEAQYEEVDSVSSCNPVRIVHD
jgi:hypothetical protein